MHPFFSTKIFKISLAVFIVIAIGANAIILNYNSPESRKGRVIRSLKMPTDYTRQDILKVIKKMEGDAEFQFYFEGLKASRRQEIINEATDILLSHRNQTELYNEIQEIYERVSSLSLLFYHMDITNEFIYTPSAYPNLELLINEFITEEFKLTILGVVYKTQHDPKFVFRWDGKSRLAAQMLYQLVMTRKHYKTTVRDQTPLH